MLVRSIKMQYQISTGTINFECYEYIFISKRFRTFFQRIKGEFFIHVVQEELVCVLLFNYFTVVNTSVLLLLYLY